MRVPFDSLCLAAAVAEAQTWLGAKAQKLVQVTPKTLALQLYAGGEGWLWLSWDAETARLVIGERPVRSVELTPFARELKRRLDGARLLKFEKVGFDRIARLEFTHAEGPMSLVAELTGKHANAMLLDAEGRMIAAARWLGHRQARRPILPGQPYVAPDLPKGRPPTEAKPGDDLSEFNGFSPFLSRASADPEVLRAAVSAFSSLQFSSYQPPGEAPYPIAIGRPEEVAIPKFSVAMARWLAVAEEGRSLESARSALASSLSRFIQGREAALAGLRAALEQADAAPRFQEFGQLVLAFGYGADLSSGQLKAWTADGEEVSISVDPELSVHENADRWFKKAKKAKGNRGEVEDQIARLSPELEDANRLLASVRLYEDLADLDKAKAHAESRRWLTTQALPTQKKEERPFEGHRVRQLVGPKGFTVLYGENAEANDYLTLRLGKPNDWWLHVRGNVSAHVLILTGNQPDRVPPEVFRFAAEIAARNSPLKHSAHIPVDITLKKHVRRPKGAPKGTVNYSHERTMHVDLA